MPKPSNLLALGAGLLTFVTACASLGTPEDQAAASSLWRELDGYQR